MQVQKSFKGQSNYGTLYLVPTPIGNLQDMTFRSVQILKEVDLICAEDTRNTGLLLKHFEIETKDGKGQVVAIDVIAGTIKVVFEKGRAPLTYGVEEVQLNGKA